MNVKVGTVVAKSGTAIVGCGGAVIAFATLTLGAAMSYSGGKKGVEEEGRARNIFSF